MEQGKSPKEIEDEIYPRIHGLVFNTAEGKIRALPVDFEKRIGSLDHIYGLYN